MNTNVRISLTDEQRQQYKDMFGEVASRANIKIRVAIMFFQALGDETPKRTAFKTVNISEKGKDQLRKKLGLNGSSKKKFVLKK